MSLLTRDELYQLRGEDEILRLARGEVAIVEARLLAAEQEALSYLSPRYGSQLPSSPEGTPAVVKEKVAALAHRKLAAGAQVAPALLAEEQQALSWLARAARGLVDIGLPSRPAVDRTDGVPLVAQPRRGPSTPGLTLGNLEDW